MHFIKKILRFFDRLEDHVRETLSRMPIIYTLIGGIAIVLFWRGVWITADSIEFLTGPVSILISVAILLVTGLFVSFFVGDVIIMSGLKKEKKLAEKNTSEIRTQENELAEIKSEMDEIRDLIQNKNVTKEN